MTRGTASEATSTGQCPIDLSKLKPEHREFFQGAEGLIFDYDGTLADSIYVWYKVDEKFFAALGRDVPENHQEITGDMSFVERTQYLRDTHGVTWTPEEMIAHWRATARDLYASEVQPRPGCLRLLACATRGKTAIATSLTRSLLDASLEHTGMISHFEHRTVSSGEIVPYTHKPEPEVYLQAAKLIGVDPAKCIVFEDTLSGVQGGKNAGMKVVNIREAGSDHYRSQIDPLADLCIQGWDDLLLDPVVDNA
ncbi:HAD hydrolase, subfamily IA [Kipferlia bialata]|uniref:HAD hydrolase, subfamily IA n=1 Tax=Kipferlia bialata TaxID=797122 RepID=A0A9K3CRW5_9EUKA|nr:HAD hydrolase, subfamily IA [Kipferlia bialata]|eukprot:g3250.t1